MARDGSETRSRLLVEAERRFAEVGIWQAATGDIVRAAGQRNSSALTYHFGSRQGVLDAVLAEHGNPIDVRRGELLAELGADADVRAVVSALVRPMTAVLSQERGRRYVRIVAQLADRFSTWRRPPEGVDHTHLSRALTLLADQAVGSDEATREARLVAMIQLMTASLAARAGELDHGQREHGERDDRTPTLDANGYERHLVDVLVGVLIAPAT
ncbi:MAG: hypothetical protein VYC56_03205 [Actinomycetota bacterium]|nr:hypothetical protein [Actinomycetota bacterium]MEC9394546.1 hypothetical protein [Actinomycetota bacterium]MEE2958913.1 hypothetical protein [Actinomycetota bacterium]